MGAANEAIVGLVQDSFFARDGWLLEAYEGEEESPRDAAHRLTSVFGDLVAEVVSKAWALPGIRDLLEAIEGSADPDDMLGTLRTALRREGLI